MKKTMLIVALASSISMPVFAQAPAGTPLDDRGTRPSPMGNPTPLEEMDTHTDHKGRTVTEDNHPVQDMDDEPSDSKQPTRHSSPGGPTDPASDPGSLE